MKEKELRECAICNYCNKPIGTSNIPGFYIIEVVGYAINMQAVRQQTGLGIMLNPALATIMGPNEDLAEETQRAKTVMCFTCYCEKLPEVYSEALSASD